MRTTTFAGAVLTMVLFGAQAGAVLASVPNDAAAARPATVITVTSHEDVNRAIADARAGDTVFLKPGVYRGPVTVDKSITLSSTQATVQAPQGGAAISVTADNVTVDSVGTTCPGVARTSQGINVTGQHVRVVGSTVLQCPTGIVLNGATDAYLQGDALLSQDSSGGASTGVDATGADGLTMLSNTVEGLALGVAMDNTSAPLLDGNTFTEVGTAVSLDSVADAVINGTLVIGARGPAVLVTGSRGAEIARLNSSGNGSGSSAAIQLSAGSGPSWVVTVEDSDFAHFASGLQVDAGSINAGVTVMGTRFDGVKGTAIVVAPGSGGTVDATIGDYFGGCGPNAADHGYDGGGAPVNDPDKVVSYREHNCKAPAASSLAATGAGSSPPAGTDQNATPPDTNAHGGIDLPSVIGSTLVTVGVSLLLATCAVGVLYAIRRSRHPS
ncbi:right-handed parallel beta-helix repeat-containing protein [Rathayibacter sp. KR2-224]|uniref:right-handed parallel beta-helix repeat-containing protein n=1 Tax=Rathayibacter sp. KR2-224 TaxID=3400913 RepID=UPI003BFA870E